MWMASGDGDMSLLDRGGSAGGTYLECRNCGMTVDDADETCPNCGSAEIAVYKF